MNRKIAFSKILSFFLTKIVIGIAVVTGLVVLIEMVFRPLLVKAHINDGPIDIIIAISDIVAALAGYVFLFRIYEQRKIRELELSAFGSNVLGGLITGLGLQSLTIFVLFIAGGYSILHVNPISYLLPGFIQALVAGFVAEILLIGIIFRITEEKAGTVMALIVMILLFTIAHGTVKGATLLSVCATVVHAGILPGAVYVFSRKLWFPIFLHFAWDFAEPTIFGGINPGISVTKNLFQSKFSDSVLLTGGQFGPQNSLQSAVLCLITALLFLWLAKRKKNFINPNWKK